MKRISKGNSNSDLTFGHILIKKKFLRSTNKQHRYHTYIVSLKFILLVILFVVSI